jgi:CubicO group peptidase (beta-lactamase class C family)
MHEASDRLRAIVDTGTCTAAAAVLTDASRAIALETFGTTRAGAEGVATAITERTRFRWASCSKPITALAALLAVQRGVLDLDAPIRRHLPDFSVHSRFADDGAARITVRHLLSHMAGLTRQAPVDNTYDDWAGHVASISDTWLRFPVGLRYAYSDIGVDLVGRVLEVVSGTSFPQFVASHVFAPLGMDDATFDRAVIRADRSRAIGHINGKLHGLSGLVPAGSMHASARDIGRFLQFVLSGGVVDGTRVLSRELLDEMTTVPFPVPGQLEGYALGVRTRRTSRGRRLGHAGRGFGFLADLAWLPEQGVGAAAVVNSHDEDIRHRVVPALLDRAIPRADAPTTSRAGAPSRPASHASVVSYAPGDLELAGLERRAGRYAGALHQTIELSVRDGRLGRVDADKFEPFRFVATDHVVGEVTQEHYRFMPANAAGSVAPPYLLRVRDGESWSYNDGPADACGPHRAEWEPVIGDYALVTRDGLTARVPVRIRNGHLYIASQRLFEDRAYCFTPRGEHVELDGDVIRVGHRTLQRIT